MLFDEINLNKIWFIMMLVVLLSPKNFETSTLPFNAFIGHIKGTFQSETTNS